MSKSIKFKRPGPRFTDPKDVAYLSFFGTGDYMMRLENVELQRRPFMPPDIAAHLPQGVEMFGASEGMAPSKPVAYTRKPFMPPEIHALLPQNEEVSHAEEAVKVEEMPMEQDPTMAIEDVPEPLIPIERILRGAGFKSEIKEIPSTSGAMDFEILLERDEEKAYAMA
jgi:hypothetical protein